MASPQLEDGHTRIANELLEAIFQRNFCQYDSRVLLAIIRHTYGWSRKASKLSLGFLTQSTLLPHRSVARSIKHLLSQNVIVRNGSETGIQKDYSKWLVVSAQPVSPQPLSVETVSPGGSKTVSPETLPPVSVETLKKERSTKERKKEERTNGEPNQKDYSDAAFSLFEDHFHRKPVWKQADYVCLAKFLKDFHMPLEEFSRRFQIYLNCSDSFHAKHGGSLKWFLSRPDEFAQIILDRRDPNYYVEKTRQAIEESRLDSPLDGDILGSLQEGDSGE